MLEFTKDAISVLIVTLCSILGYYVFQGIIWWASALNW